ncbi:hypothetical protein HK096_010842 [Nowakowskiella sp. JEL0078]|nr:hypothetical protein HK096_010842 [Nowakowskiella sp. JEL0078]
MKSPSIITLLFGITFVCLFIYNFHPYIYPSGISLEREAILSKTCPDSITKECSVCPAIVSNSPSEVTDLSGLNAAILPFYLRPTNLQPLVSKLANQMDFETKWFKTIHKKLYQTDEIQMHRKRWEMVYIANIVLEMGLCSKGKKGLVWAAGQEILVSFFAGYGCSILATDMPPDGADISAWSNTGQFASSKESLFLEKYVAKNDFDELNLFEIFDETLKEHVGSILLGQKFIIDAMDLLKPGGVAIHTTEFTLSSLDKTVDTGITVLWRKQDVEYLVHSLKVLGFEVYPMDFGAGTGIFDQKPDLPPYNLQQHIKLQIGQHIATSYGIIIKKPESWANKLTPEQNFCKN